MTITDRSQVTGMILAAKVRNGVKWAEVAARVGQSKEWTTAACLGQMTLTTEQAGVVGTLFGLRSPGSRSCRTRGRFRRRSRPTR